MYSNEELRNIDKQKRERLENDKRGNEYISAANIKISCPHCHHDFFHLKTVLLNTRGASFFGFDWLNDSSNVLICVKCGYLQWFSKGVTKIEV